MKFISLSVLFMTILGAQLFAQESIKDLEPSNYYDFWLGEWDLTWQDTNGETQRGKNVIERVLNGKVIKENFEALTGNMAGYTGKSYTVYNPKTGEWKQTWVDSDGAYLDFTGRTDGEKRIFYRETKNDKGEAVLQQMVFYDIKQNSLMWNWERSQDNGKNWEILWKIAYRRHE